MAPVDMPGGQELFSPFYPPEGAPTEHDAQPDGVGRGPNSLLRHDPLASVHHDPLDAYPVESEAHHSPPSDVGHGANHLLKHEERVERSVPLDVPPPQHASVERQLPPRSDAGIDLRLSDASVPGDPVSPIPEPQG